MYINWSKVLEKANLVKLRLHFDLMSALESLDENPKDVSEDELRYAIMRGRDRLAQASGRDKVYLRAIVSALEIEMAVRRRPQREVFPSQTSNDVESKVK